MSSGVFTSASEVVREAFRLFDSYHSVQGANLAALKADIAQGLDDQAAGRAAVLDIDAIKAEGR
jgi:antitoxin ParD1/3/4